MLEHFKDKYTKVFGELPKDMFETIFGKLNQIYTEQDELIEEAYNHKDLSIVRLKTFIDDKTKNIVELAANGFSHIQPKIITHKIEIQERVINPNQFNIDELPRPTALNSSGEMYQMENNPYVEDFKNKYGEEISESVTQNYSHQGPVIYIPTKKKIKKTI